MQREGNNLSNYIKSNITQEHVDIDENRNIRSAEASVIEKTVELVLLLTQFPPINMSVLLNGTFNPSLDW